MHPFPRVSASSKRLAGLLLLATLSLVLSSCQQAASPHPKAEFPPGTALEYKPGASGPVKSVTLPDPSGKPFSFSYEVIDGLVIYQGDMILGTAADFETANDADEITAQSTALYRRVCWTFLGINVHCENYRWPNAVVPYDFQNDWDDSSTAADENAIMRARVLDAIAEIEAVTAVRFVARTSQSDYVRFRSSDGCSATVGHEGGKQNIRLSTGCGKWSVVHEMLHALGIQHEQTRHDRDSFVTINFDNILSGKKHNFEKQSLAFDLRRYDYDSVMHYGANAFCKKDAADACVGPTIVPIASGTAIGQRTSMSSGDIAAVNLLYPGLPPTLSITGPSSGSSFSHRSANIFFTTAIDDPEDMAVTVSWTSNVDGALGTGTNLTVFTGNLSYGEHVVTARGVDPQGNAASDTVTFTIINDPPVVDIVQPVPGTFCVNESITFVADVLDRNEVGGTLADSAVAWRVGTAAPFGTGASVDHSFTAAGSYQVNVRATDPLGAYDEDTITIGIDPCTNLPPVVSISSPATDLDIVYDGFDDDVDMWYVDLTLSGSADDAEDGALSGSSLVWTTNLSSLQSPGLGTGPSVNVRLYSNVCTGLTHAVTLSATDSDGNVRTTFRRISIYTIC